MSKKLVLTVLVAALLLFLFVFLRSKILNKPAGDSLNPKNTLENILKPIFSSSTTTEAEKTPNTAKLPPYKGRNPQEFNPNSETVKAFTDQQKEQLSADLKKYGEMVKNQPEYASAWLQIGLLKKVIGDYVGARDAWEYVTLTRPKEQVAYKNLADLYWRYLSDYQKAEYNFKKAVSLKPEDISTYISFYEFYSSSGKNDLALSTLKQGLETNPGELDLIKTIASFYEGQKDYKQALEWWLKAQEKDPGDTGIGQAIEDIKLKIR